MELLAKQDVNDYLEGVMSQFIVLMYPNHNLSNYPAYLFSFQNESKLSLFSNKTLNLRFSVPIRIIMEQVRTTCQR